MEVMTYFRFWISDCERSNPHNLKSKIYNLK